MQSSKNFLRKHGFFIFLLVVLLSISGGLGIYTYTKSLSSKKDTPAETKPDPGNEGTTTKVAEVNSFEGRYDALKNQVNLNWSYTSNSSKVTSVKLYYKDYNDPINVTSYRQYDISVDLYALHTGENEFKLQLVLSDGSTIEATTKVFVNYVLRMKQDIRQVGSTTLVTLTYVYDSLHPVNVPGILCLNSEVDCSIINYKETTTTDGGDGRISAQTTYEFVWNEVPVKYQTFYVRWKFDDIYQNMDYQVVKGTKP